MNNYLDTVSKIVKDILAIPEATRVLSGTVKLEHHDGAIRITRLGNIAKYSRTKCAANIRVWYNHLTTKKDLTLQVEHFIHECESIQCFKIFSERFKARK